MDKHAALRQLTEALAVKLEQKSRAYGSAHTIQPRVWRELLVGYRNADGTYTLPERTLEQIPRITRVLDRIIRTLSHEEDPMAENPWLDMAGDALAGAQAHGGRTDEGHWANDNFSGGPVGTAPYDHERHAPRMPQMENQAHPFGYEGEE